MGYIKKSLLATAFVVSAGFIQIATDPLTHIAYGGSVSENSTSLLKTLECPGCDLFGAYLHNARLSQANLHAAKLSNADLSNADLSGANLNNADLQSVNLSRAVLFSANLSQANLGNANLRDANLRHADLDEANVQFADFTGAVGLSKEEKEDLKKRGATVD